MVRVGYDLQDTGGLTKSRPHNDRSLEHSDHDNCDRRGVSLKPDCKTARLQADRNAN